MPSFIHSFIIVIIIKRRSGINSIPPTVKDRDYKKKQMQKETRETKETKETKANDELLTNN